MFGDKKPAHFDSKNIHTEVQRVGCDRPEKGFQPIH